MCYNVDIHLTLTHLSNSRPSPGEIRQIYIEKSSEQLGITIEEGSGGGAASKKGVFVSSVSENSLASQVGLQVRSNHFYTYKIVEILTIV